jgi:hypothetical protein
MAGGAGLIELSATGCRVARSQRRARELVGLRALTRVVNPAGDGADLLLAQIRELRHRGQLRGLGNAGSEEQSDQVGVLVAPDDDGAAKVGGLAARHQVQAVAVGTTEHNVGFIGLTCYKIC